MAIVQITKSEWDDARENIRDLERVKHIGFRMFRAFWGRPLIPDEEWFRNQIAAFAHLLDLAFSGMDRNARRQLRRHMLGRGRFREPGLREEMTYGVEAHQLLNAAMAQGVRPTLLELLLMAHDVEAYVRPNLRRLLWLTRISGGKTRTPYPTAQLTTRGEQASIGPALKELKEWIRSPSSRVLDPEERRALRELIRSFKGSHPDQINLDELRNWVGHREFFIESNRVLLHLHHREGERKRLRLLVPRQQVTQMRLEMVGLVSLMKGFEWMFRLHEATPGMAYRRRPKPHV